MVSEFSSTERLSNQSTSYHLHILRFLLCLESSFMFNQNLLFRLISVEPVGSVVKSSDL